MEEFEASLRRETEERVEERLRESRYWQDGRRGVFACRKARGPVQSLMPVRCREMIEEMESKVQEAQAEAWRERAARER